jgi:hypothetical protein
MFKIKIALIGCSMVVALSTAAQAFDLRIGNGGTWVTVPDSSTDGSVDSRRSPYHPGTLGDGGTANAHGFVASPSGMHLRTKVPSSVR